MIAGTWLSPFAVVLPCSVSRIQGVPCSARRGVARGPRGNGDTVAERLGCFRCHGSGGRGASRNPGSLKGYIPPWDGHDFAEKEEELRALEAYIGWLRR